MSFDIQIGRDRRLNITYLTILNKYVYIPSETQLELNGESTMPRTLKAEQFEGVPSTGADVIPGAKILQECGFNPNLCKIEVDDGGVLSVTQERYLQLNIGPMFWREVAV
jgi:hypothetical protein